MKSVIKDEAMIDLLVNLYPSLTVNEIKEILPEDTSFETDKDINSILNELNFATESAAIITLFKNTVLQKRGKLKDEMRKKAENYFKDDVGVDTFTVDRKIGKGKTVLTIDILGRKENQDLCAFILDDIDVASFESFKTMLATILSYEKISPVEIFLILPQVDVKKETIAHIKENKALKYVKTSGAEFNAQFKPITYESEIPRASVLSSYK